MPAMFLREIVVKYRRSEVRSFGTRAICDGRAVYRAFRYLARYPREHLVAVLLDARNRVIGFETVSIGTHQASLVAASCVFQAAILCGAVGIILVHQHPSGDPTPSREDRQVTARMRAVGELLGIPLLDHVVIGESGYVSLAEAGQFKPLV